jgi:FixJ family two-component response regulator
MFEPASAPTATHPTVFVIEDDPDIRRATCLLLESVDLAAEPYASAQHFLDVFDPDRAGCIVSDVRMPGMTGLEMQKRLAEQQFRPPIIFMTAHAEISMAIEAMRAGAHDFIQKPFSPQALLECVYEALERDRASRRAQMAARAVRARVARLTLRERQVMKLLAGGKSTKSIAAHLSISPKTVDNHRGKVLRKLEVDNATELANLLLASRTS